MLYPILICCAMIGDDGSAIPKAASDRTAYESARPRQARTPPPHVRLALWCEQHGLSAERVKHLALAIAYDPANVLARGLAGLVAYHGRWTRPEDLGREAKSDPAQTALVREYLDRRTRAPHTGRRPAQAGRLVLGKGPHRAGTGPLYRGHAGSIRLARRRGSTWVTRSRVDAGSSPKTRPPRSSRPRRQKSRRSALEAAGWRSCATGLIVPAPCRGTRLSTA